MLRLDVYNGNPLIRTGACSNRAPSITGYINRRVFVDTMNLFCGLLTRKVSRMRAKKFMPIEIVFIFRFAAAIILVSERKKLSVEYSCYA